MKTNRLFWVAVGLLFLLFNFYINGFDLLPNAVGYIFIIFGLIPLRKSESAFKVAIPCILPSLLSATIDLVYPHSISYPLPFTIVMHCLSAIFYYFLGKGITNLLKEGGFLRKANMVSYCFAAQIGIMVCNGLFMIPFFYALNKIRVLMFFFVILNVAIGVLLVFSLLTAWHTLQKSVTMHSEIDSESCIENDGEVMEI